MPVANLVRTLLKAQQIPNRLLYIFFETF